MRKKSETVLNCKIYRLIMVYAIGASAFLQVGFVMVREESIPSTDLSKNADAHATTKKSIRNRFSSRLSRN